MTLASTPPRDGESPTPRRTLADRDKDLRQLLRLLGLAKAGQPKSVLICGDAGIGKTALMDAFCDAARQRCFSRVVDLRGALETGADTPEQLYVACIEALQDEADAVFGEALETVNEILQTLNLRWGSQDLRRAVSLVKLQESIGGSQALSQESLVKAIRSSVATPAKKLRGPALAEVIEQLVHVIVNPWLLAAVNLTHPLTPPLREAVELAQRLRAGEPLEAAQKAIVRQSRPAQEAPDARQTVIDYHLDYLQSPSTPPKGALDPLTAPNAALTPPMVVAEEASPALALPAAPNASFAPSLASGVTPATSEGERSALMLDALIERLMGVLLFINKAIEPLDSALLIVFDSWELILALDEGPRNDLKEFLAGWLRELLETPNGHLMLALTCRSEGQSDSLGGPLYSLFRNKLLLTGLQERPRRSLFLAPFREQGVDIDEATLHAIFRLTEGNPLWLLKMRHVLMERAHANSVSRIDMPFFRNLGVDRVEDLLESSLTRLELAFLNQEEALFRIIAGLLRQYGQTPFEVAPAVTEISASQGVSELLAAEVLRHLYLQDFLTAAPPLTPDSAPRYRFQSRQVVAFLGEKTRQVSVDASTGEKIAYLRKIIPLSVRSGELDREKTREVLQLCAAMGDQEMIPFLEETFLQFVADENPLARLSSLNNLAVLESPRALNAVLGAIRDEDAVVREYAVRNLALMARKTWDAATHERIVAALIDALDDETDAVRSQAYLTLSRYQWTRDLTPVFIKGMADACDAVRLTAVAALCESGDDAPLLRQTFLDAAEDRDPGVRRHAIAGLQRFEGDDIIERLSRMLSEDPESVLRAAVADALSVMPSEAAHEALLRALESDPDEDVKITIVRALGRHRGWASESRLLRLLNPADPIEDETLEARSPGLLWACVRALGQAGATAQSLQTLHRLRARTRNEIIRLAIDVAIRRITDRLEDMRQFEEQIDAAVPLMVAEPEPPPDPNADLPEIEEEQSV